MQEWCCPDDEKEENDVEGQNQNQNRMPEIPSYSELTKQDQVL